MAHQHVTRRLAAILAADVVGYSRLMGEDEAGTLTALKALRKELLAPKVVEHHGRVVKLRARGGKGRQRPALYQGAVNRGRNG